MNHIESAPGVKAHEGYCLGPISDSFEVDKDKFGIIIIEEYFDKDGIIRIVKRNPALMSLASFYSFCRPKGGLLSSDGLYCEYKVKF